MTVHFTCPSCGDSKPLRLEGASRPWMTGDPVGKMVAWYVISCTKCQMVFEVLWNRDKVSEEKVFAYDKRLDEEIQRLRDVT
jgi:transcription elongation factor Elf1